MKRISVLLYLGLIILERLSKWLVLSKPDLYQSGLIELKLFKNPNLYFISFDSGFLYFLIGLALLLLIFLLFISWQKRDFFLMSGFSLIIIGGSSNLLDRVIFGYVIDWIRIFILPASVFNLADLMIISGMAILLKRSYIK